eukprot:8443504-Alexandrium_andersonii.AAC.1
MVTAAVTLPPSVLRALEAAKLPNAYIHENKYFAGQGADASERLSEEGRVKVIGIADADMTNQK